MAHKAIKTAIDIAASPKVVWEILTDFESYKDWNPFLTSVEGEFVVGNKIRINAGGMKFQPILLAFEQEQELRWLGSLFFKGIFDGEHSFQIIDNGDGTSTLKHEEQFNGILVGWLSKKIDHEVKHSFEAMNQKLKERAEAYQ